MNRETKIIISREQVTNALAQAAHEYIGRETAFTKDDPFLTALIETDCALIGSILNEAIISVLFGDRRHCIRIPRCEFTAACFSAAAAVIEDFNSFLATKTDGDQETKDFGSSTLYDFAVYVLRDAAEILFRSEGKQKGGATGE